MGTRRQLVTDLSIDFNYECVHKIPVGKYGPLGGPLNFLILGDTFHGPEQIYIFPEIQTINPGEKNTCTTLLHRLTLLSF